jgi:hypothetical protein
MKRVKSSYKVFGDFGILLLLNGIVGVQTYRLLTSPEIGIAVVDLWNDTGAQIDYAIVLGLQLLFLFPFITNSRFIIADNNGITFINPLLPFLRRTTKWTDFDCYMIVQPSTEYPTDESIWLIRDGKLAARFSSAYYSNYNDLKNQILTRKKTLRDLRSIEHLLILFGLRRIED